MLAVVIHCNMALLWLGNIFSNPKNVHLSSVGQLDNKIY